jgi:hypothetical protein
LLFGFSLPGLDVWHEDDAAATVTVQQSQKQKQSQQQQQPPQPQPLSASFSLYPLVQWDMTPFIVGRRHAS